MKSSVVYVCQSCGAIHPKWMGQCCQCGAWSTLMEEKREEGSSVSPRIDPSSSGVTALSEVEILPEVRCPLYSGELNRVLGGGLVAGSVVLVGGDPGIGKTTLLLQTLSYLSPEKAPLYVTGEESLQQVTLRARRLGLPETQIRLLSSTEIESILGILHHEKPSVVVVDSIQTMASQALSSAPGSVSQVRECAARLVQFAKRTGTSIFIVGHVTKEGMIAGPRVLEHMVDTVLYFEGDAHDRFRVIRAVKNRFGAVNELGVFVMTDKGLRDVSNPSLIFLSPHTEPVSGSITMATWEGSRPILIEIQALVDESHLANPRRVTIGLEQNRLTMLLAVLHRHGRLATFDKDIFVNAVGGVRVTETASDLAMLFAIVSSIKDFPLPRDLIVFGEIGLSGEIRPVQNGQDRLREAAKHGFHCAVVPKGNLPKGSIKGMELIPVEHIQEALPSATGAKR